MPQDLVKSWSREIGLGFSIVLELHRYLDSSFAEILVNLERDTLITTSNLAHVFYFFKMTVIQRCIPANTA